MEFLQNIEFDLRTIITLILASGAFVSGIWLFILKKVRKDKNDEKEMEYQRELASEYRKEWLKNQQTEE